MAISSEQLDICLAVLQEVSEDPSVMNEHERFKALVAKIHKGGKKGDRDAARRARTAQDLSLQAKTAMVRIQGGAAPAPLADFAAVRLGRPRKCYVCKAAYADLHFFYHLLCPDCADFNHRKRAQRADLTGRVALVTGGRIKIGYQTALRLLRDGARVIVTSRFPADALGRFEREPDTADWRDRLTVHGLDLRNLPAVEAFTRYLLDTEPALDILINNAAQTVKRPLEFYRHLIEGERREGRALPLLESLPGYPPVPREHSANFPRGAHDADGQQLDFRPVTSWILKLEQVDALEMLEVYLVGAAAPFLLNGRLKPLLLRSPFARRFIVNVSAMEGQYARETKTPFHPHTNMAKAALNMMTRTCAPDYARDGIYMNSVDTGWITDENPFPKKTRVRETHGFHAPLDVIDGMARIYDPIAQGLRPDAAPPYGHFLKDYAPHPW